MENWEKQNMFPEEIPEWIVNLNSLSKSRKAQECALKSTFLR